MIPIISRRCVAFNVFFIGVLAFQSTKAHILGLNRALLADAQREVEIFNESGRRVDVLWVNDLVPDQPESFVSQTESGDLAYGASTHINSFNGHTFVIQELPGKQSGNCLEPQRCWNGRFTINGESEQEVRLEKGFIIHHTGKEQRSVDKARSLYEKCEERIGQELDTAKLIDAMADCVKTEADAELEVSQEEVDFQIQVRSKLADSMGPLACGDVNYTLSESLRNETWWFEDKHDSDRARRSNFQVETLHQRPNSFIASIDGFLTPEECFALEHFEVTENDGSLSFAIMDKVKAAPERHFKSVLRLTDKLAAIMAEYMGWGDLNLSHVMEEDGRLFQVRKDLSGGVKVPQLLCTADDVEAEKKTGTRDCKLPGEGSIRMDTTHGHVEPPEEGADGLLATAFIFCQEPLNQQLGALNFPHADVHVAPKPGRMVMAIHRKRGEQQLDGYVQDYHLCPNHQLYTHSFYERVAIEKES